MERERPLPDPVVAPGEYDTDYYLGACAGYEEWAASEGRELSGIYEGSLLRADLQAGERLVDIGTGRGELLVAAAKRGARAVGVEYSPAAVELARHTLSVHGHPPGAEVLLADARAIPLPDGETDLVTLLDVVEHLAPDELELALAEARRLLAPGGRILIHTLPNRLIYDVTYRLLRSLPGNRRWPRDPRNEYERRMHVNEQTRPSLRRSLRRAGFRAISTGFGPIVLAGFVPSERGRVLMHRLAAHRLTAPLGRADIWAEARR